MIHLGMVKCSKQEKNLSYVWDQIKTVFSNFGIRETTVTKLFSISDEGTALNCN